MWKRLNTILLFLFIAVHALAQIKPQIDAGMLNAWPRISPSESSLALSRSGRYVAYVIYKQPVGQNTLVVQDLRGRWKKIAVGMNSSILFFSEDSRQLCWQQGDSILLQQTGGEQSRLLGISKTISYPTDKKGEWLILSSAKDNKSLKLLNILTGKERTFSSIEKYSWVKGGNKLLLNTSKGDLKVLNLVDGKEHSFPEVKEYVLNPDGKSILLRTTRRPGEAFSLQWMSLEVNKALNIWMGIAGEQPGDYVFDKAGKQLVFTVRSANGKKTIWYYKTGAESAILKTDDTGLALGLPISGINSFSPNGRWLFFNVRKQLPSFPQETVTAPVDIWTYRDETLNPAQLEKLSFRDYVAVMEIGNKKVQLLEKEDDEVVLGSLGDYRVLRKGGAFADLIGSWWPHSQPLSYWLISLADGKRSQLNAALIGNSPQGRWIFDWDTKQENYLSLDPYTGKSIALNLPVSTANTAEQLIEPLSEGMGGWYANDIAVLVYDNYDIWKLDPSGKIAPINITNGYGRRHGIKLRIVGDVNEDYLGNEELLLSGFDVETKHNGFFRIKLNKLGIPEPLTMGPYTYYQTTIVDQSFNRGMIPLVGGKGKDKRWIVMRESAAEYPNFYVSQDLKEFKALTNLRPQKAYNWMITEVVKWKMYNGQSNNGVLYKPENFDPHKRYPVIFNYYEKYSHRCYQFPMPGLTTDNINIPWFVSRGYLVFTPDIQYVAANKPSGMTTGESAYNTVASAAEYLSQRPYVDKNRIAIQGHSFGGLETNNIITQTSYFAAAAEVAGTADPISSYLTLVNGGTGVQESTHKQDHEQGRMGATPWERPDLFRRNSAVLNADKVKTPLLITHNKKDGAVNFRQGVEMYMALRRLGKPCWLLQYDNSGHTLRDKKDALDYTIRLTQYFDHYLKGEPAPQWMTMNTLAAYKGKNNLYDLDPKGNCGKDCKVCKEWNEKEISRGAQANVKN